jgi:hypothetical protein
MLTQGMPMSNRDGMFEAQGRVGCYARRAEFE